MTLLPCPFCAMRGRHLRVDNAGGFDEPSYYVRCDNCSTAGPAIRPGVDTDGNFTMREAREAWNTRNWKRDA